VVVRARCPIACKLNLLRYHLLLIEAAGQLPLDGFDLNSPGGTLLTFPVIIGTMKKLVYVRFCRGLATTILITGLNVATSTAADAPLPAGVSVRVDEATARNQVRIQIGEDMLAVDLRDDSSAPPARYFLATGALSTSAGGPAIELWPETRPRDVRSSGHTVIVFGSGFTLADPKREIVLFDLGRCATAGDAAVWLPAERVLVMGRTTSVGRVEATAETDIVAWIAALRRLQGLDPRLVIPGHGAPGGGELLTAQIERLTTLAAVVESDLLAGATTVDIASGSTPEWLVEWRRHDPQAAYAAVEAVVAEVGGLRPPWELLERRELREGPSPIRTDPGWSPPAKVLWLNLWPDRLSLLAVVAPGVEIVPFDSTAEAMMQVADADAIIGAATPELLAAGTKLRWIQVGSAGVEDYLAIPQLGSGEVLLTNGQKLAAPEIAEHVMALARALARGLNQALAAQFKGTWERSEITDVAPLSRLRGKTMLVVGLGGIGTEVARLASAAEMRVIGIRSSSRSGPSFVDRVGLPADLPAFTAEADVVVNCLPLTPETTGLFNAQLFDTMKPTAFFINVGRGGTVVTDALVVALEEGSIAGAGLDVTDPEPLPADHPLWKAPNVIITPHYAARSDIDRERFWLLFRENLRRFVAGEPLLSVVDPERGY
jgi:phosphoglycerate dehydrogenase-like enzyme/glyoxylase-like metal-dependent hydrolase (beta-lactamase superfamily II)